MKKYAVIVAGGSGSRMHAQIPKQFMLLGKLPVLMHTISRFYQADSSIEIIIVLPHEQIAYWQDLCNKYSHSVKHTIVKGGNTRFESVKNGLNAVDNDCLVAIHDGVRPLVSASVINESYRVASTKGSAIAAVTLKDSIRKQKGNHTISKNRSNYFLIQTPQTFQSSLIKKAYSSATKSATYTDDATVLESNGGKIVLIDGEFQNLKITMPEDMIFAQAWIKAKEMDT